MRLIIDMDETLLTSPKIKTSLEKFVVESNRVSETIVLRPGTKEFLKECKKLFSEVDLFTNISM